VEESWFLIFAICDPAICNPNLQTSKAMPALWEFLVRLCPFVWEKRMMT